MSDKQKYLQTIEENASLFTDVSDQIWDFAELSLMEFQSAKLYCEVLAKEGFTVEAPIAGIETAFKASYGSGKPVIGILAEYDALTGLSQQAGAVERKEIVSGGCGHGCGCLCHQKISGGRTQRHRHLLWLSRRRGRRCQSLYGARPHLGGAGCCFDLAPRRCQPGHLRHLHGGIPKVHNLPRPQFRLFEQVDAVGEELRHILEIPRLLSAVCASLLWL